MATRKKHINYCGMEDYQRDVSKFINKDLTETEMENHGVFGLCSEAGEVAGIFQKYYQGHNIDEEHLKKEMGDVLWFLAEIATACGFSLAEVATMNYDKLSARYPNGFEVEKSLHRKKGDI